jgi:hypothetical protein
MPMDRSEERVNHQLSADCTPTPVSLKHPPRRRASNTCCRSAPATVSARSPRVRPTGGRAVRMPIGRHRSRGNPLVLRIRDRAWWHGAARE